ncbi:hypothetical protein GCM10009830_04080 [Glycomyces endophyticus]|uniref:Mycothiol-dependent maleylpyruvate isomerase metal-binding domain-containing protein n=2 Tax=Glycomyces endophyticus TaxID=480996 RepID=A0ABP4RUL9_9ACTN
MDAFRECVASGDLGASIAFREEFAEPIDLAGLARAVGHSNLFTAACVTEWTGGDTPPDGAPPLAPQDRGELLKWLEGTAELLVMSLDVDADTPAWGHFTPPNAGYWQRSIAVETMLHRWDAQQTVGLAAPLDPDLASAGVSEVLEVLAPKMIGVGKAWPPDACVKFNATDTDDWWIYGPGDPVAEVHSTAGNLLLMLWGRMHKDHPSLVWEGDRTLALSVLKGPLTY